MAWDEWEQLKAEAADGRSTRMQLDRADDGGPPMPGSTGDLKVGQADLARIDKASHVLYGQLWDKARVAVPTSDSAAGDLSKQGFTLGEGLRHVSSRWEGQLRSLMDACAQISNHMQVTRTPHAGDEDYILRQMSSIDTLDAGFDERVGAPGRKNPVYDDKSDSGDKKQE
jgi:hypothetical protein